MNDGLPEGWVSVPISGVTERVPNANPEDEPRREFGYVDISAIDNTNFTIGISKRFRGSDAPSRARRPIQPKDVLFSNVRTYLRNVALVESQCPAELCSTGFTVLRPSAAVEPRYLFRYVLTDDFIERVTPQQTGTHYPATSDRVVMAEQIRLAPLREQRRIVRQVEALLSKVRSSQERLDKIPTLIRRFRQSVLTAACTGMLTADWRASRGRSTSMEIFESPEDAQFEVPEGWRWEKNSALAAPKQGAICAGPFGTIFKARDFRDAGVPIIFLRHVSEGKYLTSKPGFMDRKKWEEIFQPYSVYGGELLVTKLGDPPGTCAIYPRGIGPAMVTPDVIKMEVNESLAKPKYLMFFFNSVMSRRIMFGLAFGVTRLRVDLPMFKNLLVPVPPIAEQEEIVRRVEVMFKLADRLEARYAKAKEQVDRLTQSILDKAFRGELVPTEAELARREGRSYETAEQLLQRIQATAERSVVAKKLKAKAGTRS